MDNWRENFRFTCCNGDHLSAFVRFTLLEHALSDSSPLGITLNLSIKCFYCFYCEFSSDSRFGRRYTHAFREQSGRTMRARLSSGEHSGGTRCLSVCSLWPWPAVQLIILPLANQPGRSTQMCGQLWKKRKRGSAQVQFNAKFSNIWLF